MIKKKIKKKETEEEEEENDDFGEVRALLFCSRGRETVMTPYSLSLFIVTIPFIFKRAARCLFATKTDFFIYSPPHLIKQNKTNRHKERERKSAGN
jgi:hypothetical protein